MKISNGQIAQPNVNVNKALEVGLGRLNQFEASWPDSYFDVCISCSLDSYLTNKRNCGHIFIPGFKEWCSVRLLEVCVHHALIGMMTTLPKVQLGLLITTRLLRCTRWTLNTTASCIAVLENYANKAQLNSLICMQILTDEQCLQQVTHTTG